jgi:hypothetical protein
MLINCQPIFDGRPNVDPAIVNLTVGCSAICRNLRHLQGSFEPGADLVL